MSTPDEIRMARVPTEQFHGMPDDQLEQMLDHTTECAEQLLGIAEDFKRAETAYRTRAHYAARADVEGDEEVFDQEIREAEADLEYFEDSITERLEQLDEHTYREGLEEAIEMVSGVYTVTLAQGVAADRDIDRSAVAALRSYGQAQTATNPAPDPLDGYVADFQVDEEANEVVTFMDTDGLYGAVQDIEEGTSLTAVFDETDLAEKERHAVEVQARAEETGNPASYESWKMANEMDGDDGGRMYQ